MINKCFLKGNSGFHLKMNISKTIQHTEVSDGSSFFHFHAVSFDFNFFQL